MQVQSIESGFTGEEKSTPNKLVVSSPPIAEDVHQQVAPKQGSGFVLLLNERALDRDCLAKSLQANNPEIQIRPAASLEDWSQYNSVEKPSVVVLVIGGQTVADTKISEAIQDITTQLPDSPLIIVADTDDLAQMLKALECGARGFIPSSVGIDVAIEAINLARAGGIFLPASGLLNVRELIENVMKDRCGPGSMFTPRESEVAESLRRGKANKIIAYELGLCESTIKVHIRSIMKKLKATNRTEVAYKLRKM